MKKLIISLFLVLLVGCGGASASSSQYDNSKADLPGVCRHEALYCAAVVGEYYPYDIIVYPTAPNVNHVECRVYVGDDVYYAHMTEVGSGVVLDENPRWPITEITVVRNVVEQAVSIRALHVPMGE